MWGNSDHLKFTLTVDKPLVRFQPNLHTSIPNLYPSSTQKIFSNRPPFPRGAPKCKKLGFEKSKKIEKIDFFENGAQTYGGY